MVISITDTISGAVKNFRAESVAGCTKEKAARQQLNEVRNEQNVSYSIASGKGIKFSAGAAVLALGLSGCAGGAGDDAAGGGGEGYEYGASVEEIQAVFEDIDPITITYQPSAQSPEDTAAPRADTFVENLERLSDGKISVDMIYGQSIAGYDELPDALVDGRVDVAYMLPIYQPDEFPIFQGYVTGTTLTGTSPLVDELAANAAFGELAWNDENLLTEFRDAGLEPLNPFNPAGAIFPMCADEHSAIEDWSGSQVRASGVAQISQLGALDASAVSMEYTEVYEALQRNTVDCTLTATLPAGAGGVPEVASNIGYTSDVTFARGPGGVYAGSAWDTWPLAVQQLVFDSMADEFSESRRVDLDGTYVVAEAVREQGGAFTEVDDEIQYALLETSEGLVDEEVANGNLPEGHTETIVETIEKWTEIAGELGYEDEGGFEDFEEWYEMGDIELFEDIGERYFDDVMLQHRPN